MRVGLIDVDGKMPNLALMKLAAWHKAQGDTVEFFNPLFSRVDRVYASKIFNSTPDFPFPVNAELIKGGSGYDLKTELPPEIEAMRPDYSLYGIDYAMGFTTRGCIRNCGFCVVPRKEGRIRVVGDINGFWNGQRNLMLLDNNLTADADHFRLVLNQLIAKGIFTNFSQGLDIRLIDDEKALLLAKVRLWKQIHFAFDSIKDVASVADGIRILTKAMPASRLMFFVLVGWDSTEAEDLYRIEFLRAQHIDPFVMPYDKHDLYQRRLARWVNHKAIFKTTAWADYLVGRRDSLEDCRAAIPDWGGEGQKWQNC